MSEEIYIPDHRGLCCALCGRTAIRHIIWHGKRLCTLPKASDTEGEG